MSSEIDYEREDSETERYIIQLLRINIIFMSIGLIILLDIGGYELYGFIDSVKGGLVLVIFITLLGFVHSAFGINIAESLENRIQKRL